MRFVTSAAIVTIVVGVTPARLEFDVASVVSFAVRGREIIRSDAFRVDASVVYATRNVTRIRDLVAPIQVLTMSRKDAVLTRVGVAELPLVPFSVGAVIVDHATAFSRSTLTALAASGTGTDASLGVIANGIGVIGIHDGRDVITVLGREVRIALVKRHVLTVHGNDQAGLRRHGRIVIWMEHPEAVAVVALVALGLTRTIRAIGRGQ